MGGYNFMPRRPGLPELIDPRLLTMLPGGQEPAPRMDEPPVEPPAEPDPLDPYMQRVQRTGDALQSEYEHAAGMQIPQPSIKRTLLGWLAGQAVPQLGQQITQGPNIQYERGMQASKMRMGALENAARIAERDLDLAQRRQLQKSQIGWYDRRVSPTEGRTIDVMHEGQPHTHQFNTKTGQYDIEAGAPIERAGGHAPNEIELFQTDEPGFQRYEDYRNRSRKRFGPRESGHAMNDIEFYRTDPAGYEQYQNVRNQGRGDIAERNALINYRNSLTRRLDDWDVEPAEQQTIRQQLADLDAEIRDMMRPAAAPPDEGAADAKQQPAGPKTAINRKTGQRLVLQRGRWVPMRKAGRK